MSWKWCYENEDKALVTGWKEIEGKWYYLNPNGTMETGWTKVEGKWYYLDPTNGDMKTGWLQDKGEWYYLASNGVMYCDCNVTIDGKEYSFNEDGIMQENILSKEGAKFIGSWEGLYLKAYEDPYYRGNKNWWTIGYGTTYAVTPEAFPNGLDSVCNEEQAISWLQDEARNCAKALKSDLESKGVSLEQYQIDSLISFAYNCGVGALLNSTLYKNICNGIKDSETIISNFKVWSKANGVTSTGLLKRRLSEAALFLNADYTGNN